MNQSTSLRGNIQATLRKAADITKTRVIVLDQLQVFDITVEDNHNYFIKVDDQTAVLSHNCLEFVVKEIIGPVVVMSKVTSLIPELQIVKTGIKFKTSKLWTYSISTMLKDKNRNRFIVEQVMGDLKEHPCIIIATDRVEHVNTLKNQINDEAIKSGLIPRSQNLAFTFYGGMTPQAKKDSLDKIETGECRVLVSMRSMIKQGIDMRKPTMLYSIIPETGTKEAGSPMFLQLSNRPCTPHLDKKQPIVKIFVDDTEMSTACFKSLFTNEIRPNLVPSARNNFGVRYKISEDQRKIAYDIMAPKKQVFPGGFIF